MNGYFQEQIFKTQDTSAKKQKNIPETQTQM